MTVNNLMLINIAKKLFKSGIVDITTEVVKLTIDNKVVNFKYYNPEQFKNFLETEINEAQQCMWKVSNGAQLPKDFEKIEFHFENTLQKYYIKFIKE